MQASVETAGGQKIARFTRDCGGATCMQAIPPMAILGIGPTDGLAEHIAYGTATFELNGSMAATTTSGGELRLFKAHAWLMLISFSLLFPLGIIAASALKSLGPTWCAPTDDGVALYDCLL